MKQCDPIGWKLGKYNAVKTRVIKTQIVSDKDEKVTWRCPMPGCKHGLYVHPMQRTALVARREHAKEKHPRNNKKLFKYKRTNKVSQRHKDTANYNKLRMTSVHELKAITVPRLASNKETRRHGDISYLYCTRCAQSSEMHNATGYKSFISTRLAKSECRWDISSHTKKIQKFKKIKKAIKMTRQTDDEEKEQLNKMEQVIESLEEVLEENKRKYNGKNKYGNTLSHTFATAKKRKETNSKASASSKGKIGEDLFSITKPKSKSVASSMDLFGSVVSRSGKSKSSMDLFSIKGTSNKNEKGNNIADRC